MSERVRALRGGGLALLAAVLWMSAGGEARACGSCYGLADGPMIDAARLGIWVMLATTVIVQGGFAAFFIYLRRRASRAAGPTHPQPGLRPAPATAGGREAQ
jgi:hypothetical protein